MKNKLTVTIGIPVFNEGRNIKKLLNSLLKQGQQGFVLEKIIIYNDNSTDNTRQIVEEMAALYPLITITTVKKRVGKCMLLNKIYKANKSDVLVTFDGDIAIRKRTVLKNMIKHFHNPRVGLVSANDFPYETKNFAQKVIGAWFMLWYAIRKNLNNGDTLYNVHGVAQAIRKNLARKIVYPKGITADQDYLYLSVKKSKYTFVHAQDAVVYIYLPRTFSEYYFQTQRFLSEKDPVREEFADLALRYYNVPRLKKIIGILSSIYSRPFYTIVGLVMYMRFLLPNNIVDPLNKKGMWTQISSTKGSLKKIKFII